MSKSKSLPILAGPAALGVAFFLASPVYATPCPANDTFCSQLNVSNGTTGVPLTGDFGSVGVRIVTPGTAEITFTANAALGLSFGQTNIADVNTSVPITAANFTAVTAGITFAGSSPPPVDGMGSFTVMTDGTPGMMFPTVVFDISNPSFVNDATVLAFNTGGGNCPLGCDAAAHEFGFGTTFFVGEQVPAPIIGHGLLVVLAVGGVLFGGKLLEDLKKRHPHAA